MSKNIPTKLGVISTFLMSISTSIFAADIDIFPPQSFATAVEALNPGDTLIVHEGTYIDSGRISITVQGSASAPVKIIAASGEKPPLITRSSADKVQNTINIQGAKYLTIDGLEISSNGGDGINMSLLSNGNVAEYPSYITLKNLEIHDIDVGINFRSNMDHITVIGNRIYNTGTDGGTGEGMYVGCNDKPSDPNNSPCVVRDSLIADNWIYDTLPGASQGDGIEIKARSHSNIIRNNTIHDTKYPCILLYGTDGKPRNIVEKNIMWNCGDSGMQIAADAIVSNNIIIADTNATGFSSMPHQTASPSNLEFSHNTVIGGSPCLRLNQWSGKTGLLFVNNAIYCGSDNFKIAGLADVVVSGNVITPGNTTAFPRNGYKNGRSVIADFTAAAVRDVTPSADSALIGAADANYITDTDYEGTSRLGDLDAGAITSSVNMNAFDFVASPVSVVSGESTTITWSSESITNCKASGGWSGLKNKSGNETVGPITQSTGFALTCYFSDGTFSRQIQINVQPAATTDGATTGDANSSGTAATATGAFSLFASILLLLATLLKKGISLMSGSKTAPEL